MGENEIRNRRGFIGKLLVFVLTLLALVGLFAMVLSVVNPYIDPNRFIWTSVFGLAFWPIFLFNVFILFLLVLLWSKKAWISVLALLIAVPGLRRSFSIGDQSEAIGSIRVMTYNVHDFRHTVEEMEKEEFANQLIGIVREQNPDLLCCQEFSAFKKKVTRSQCIQDFADAVGFQYVYYNKKRNYGGNVVFSKYPIEKVEDDSGFAQENTYGVMVSVDAGDKGKFYLANVHLLSYRITDNEIDILVSPSERQMVLDTIGKSLLHKLGYAFKLRSEEMAQMMEGLPANGSPVLVCGDFNEPPMSYNYRQMQKAGYVDTFTKAGRGIKSTYAGKLPLLRIDYIWANDRVTPLCFKRNRIKASDHYPIVLDFKIQ